MGTRAASLALSLLLAVVTAIGGVSSGSHRRGPAGERNGNIPPPNAAARIQLDAGSCIQFISVFVPSGGGHFVVGLSFAYHDLNQDGEYTPGIDRMSVCVNCSDACGFGP